MDETLPGEFFGSMPNPEDSTVLRCEFLMLVTMKLFSSMIWCCVVCYNSWIWRQQSHSKGSKLQSQKAITFKCSNYPELCSLQLEVTVFWDVTPRSLIEILKTEAAISSNTSLNFDRTSRRQSQKALIFKCRCDAWLCFLKYAFLRITWHFKVYEHTLTKVAFRAECNNITLRHAADTSQGFTAGRRCLKIVSTGGNHEAGRGN
jgi:hypothetical protein